MKLSKEQSLNMGDNSYSQIRDLNETQISHITKESADRDYKEYLFDII